jgi:hypothetical protein
LASCFGQLDRLDRLSATASASSLFPINAGLYVFAPEFTALLPEVGHRERTAFPTTGLGTPSARGLPAAAG